MPKERKPRSFSFDRRARASPFPSNSASPVPPDSGEPTKEVEEWDEVRCPVCMEHPHNAVLLICASHDKGSRPFMCDTSYRHSNCLDQYRKVFSGFRTPQDDGDTQQNSELSCPLCRGPVTGWTVVEPARKYMNVKTRSCSTESCAFSGIYRELRKHARKEHSFTRPSEADPERQQDWRRMERQRDLGDLFSMFLPSITEEDVINVNEDDEEAIGSMLIFPSINMLLVVHIRRTGENDTGRPFLPLPRSFSSSSLRSSRGRRESRAILWGDTLSNLIATDIMDQVEGNENGGTDELDTASHENGGRLRRQFLTSDTDDDEDDFPSCRSSLS